MKASLLLTMLVPLAWCAPEAADELDERCDDDCSDAEKPVCANDGNIYQNSCLLYIAQCKAKDRGEELEEERCENHLSDDQRKLLETAFSKFARKRRGISRKRLRKGMRRYFNKVMTKRELRRMFKRADVDGSKQIDLPEFLEFVAKKMLRKTEENKKFWFDLYDKNGDEVIDANEQRSAKKLVGLDGRITDYQQITYSDFVQEFEG